MKIIDIAICVDNVDPKGIGRIRCVGYNDYIGEKENAVKYVEWDDKDPFVALPFLPSNINYIPEVEQIVKVIRYNTDKETVNQEYIAGPFTTMYDYNGQTFAQQIENTTYGIVVKHKPDIRNTSGQYINSKSENVFAKEKDFAVYGKNNSDILFTENGVQLRGGKLLSKEAASKINRELLLDVPLMARKNSRIQLKKFPKKLTLGKTEEEVTTFSVADLNYIVEYNISNLSITGGTTVDFFVYKVLQSYGNTLKTNFFSETTPLPVTYLKLINENEDSSPTYSVTGLTSTQDLYMEIRDFLFEIHDKSLREYNPLYSGEDIHPFYFRPKSDFLQLDPINVTESSNKKTILNSVKLSSTVGPSSGLVWSKTSMKVPSQTKLVVRDFLKYDENTPEQTFAAVTADNLYLLSTEDISTDTPIDFESLDKYEYTQENYVKSIDPNTYATVRGEKLIIVLRAILNVIYTHVHNINKSIEGQSDYPEGEALKQLINNLENDILNKNIRIN
jgi:hypothetical protein